MVVITDILVDARRGGGAPAEILFGTVTFKPTLAHQRGTSIVLPAPTTFDLVDGTVVATNIQPTPPPVNGEIEWAYQVVFKDRHSKTYSFLVGVPDSTTQVNFATLPRYFETKPPLFGAGPKGDPGEAATVSVGTTTSGTAPSVTNSGTGSAAVLDFVLPKGDKGDRGDGVPAGGSALQYIRKDASGSTTEWASLERSDVGLGNVDNTSDAEKPVSVATQKAIDERGTITHNTKYGTDAISTYPYGFSVTNVRTANGWPIVGGSSIHFTRIETQRVRGLNTGIQYATAYVSDSVGDSDQNEVLYRVAVDGGSWGEWQKLVTDVPGGFVKHRSTTTVDDKVYSSAYREWSAPLRSNGPGGGGLAIGEGAAENITEYTDAYDSRDFIAIGRDALKNATSAPLSMAFGAGAMSKGTGGFGNQAFGTWSLMHVSGGHRNIGFGSLTMPFLTTGYQNTIMGRDAGQGFLTARRNVGIGYRSLGCGHQPVGLSGEIEHQFISNAEDCVAMGNDALRYTTGYKNVGIGSQSGASYTYSWGNTFVGAETAQNFGIDVSENGFALDRTEKTGTYSQAGNTLTVTVAGHGVASGKKVGLTFSSGLGTSERQWLVPASIPNANTLIFTSPKQLAVTGTVVIDTVETGTAVTLGRQITVVGQGALLNAKNIGNNTTVIGADAAPKATGTTNTIVGSRAGGYLTTGYNNTLFGYNAGRLLVDGSEMNDAYNVTSIGNNSGVSGSNQVQLGNSATTTYVYGTVQNRSDRRDKADVRDTVLGLEFIKKLRPVDYRWDMREDYEDFIPDGTMKRERFHHGLIAQEVAEVIETTGQDFGGFQDHSISGGADILSIGYDEFIAPLIRAVQELSDRLEAKNT